MDQQIRFCTTSDGVRIAYATVGEGPPLILTPHSWGTLSFELETPYYSHFHRALAERHLLIVYDRSGVGLSDLQRTDFTVEADVRDLEAVADHLGLERFVLMGMFQLGPAAIVYAARHPQRVSRLVLYGTYARGRDLTADEVKGSMINMARSHWGMASRTFADLAAPGAEGDQLEGIARSEREAASGETVARLLEMAFAVDVVDLVPKVQAPTLVVHRRGDRCVPFRLGRELSLLLQSARLVTLEGDNHFPWFGDSGAVLRAIFDFLGVSQEAPAPDQPSGGLVTILFTDIVGHTEMMQRLGDERGRDVLREHERITREALLAHGGAEVKTDGDSFMASFVSVSAAVECAVALQRAFAAYSETTGEPIVIRIGLNVGEPIEEDGDFFGSAVILGARIKDQAAGGEILVPEAVRHLLAGKNFLFSDRGEVALKGFEDMVRLYEVRWRESQA